MEIIVVDNASHDGSARKLKRQFPEVILIENEMNLGYTGGNNVGMAAASGDYFLLLNNDTEVHPHFLEPMIELGEKHSKVGAISPKILYYDSQDTLQYAGGGTVNFLFSRFSWKGWQEKDAGQYNDPVKTTLAHGAALLVKRKVVEGTGMLNSHFFSYYEEIDWSLRIRNDGYLIYYMPQSVVWHKASMTVKKDNPRRIFFMNRNRIYLNRIHAGFFEKVFSTVYLLTISLPVNTFRFYAQQKPDLLRAYLRGVKAGFFDKKINNVDKRSLTSQPRLEVANEKERLHLV